VNAQAGTVTYDGQSVAFDAIGSTAAVDAIDNIGVTGAPVYLVDGTLVTSTDSTSGLWSGALGHLIDEDLTGLQIGGRSWTGTLSNGSGASGRELGASLPITGDTGLTDSGWVDASSDRTSDSTLSMYGISEVLTVPQSQSVPEPSSAILVAAAVGVGLPFDCVRRWRDRRRR
jgi:hypothetical protein